MHMGAKCAIGKGIDRGHLAASKNIREGGLLNLTDPAELATGNNGARFIHHAHRAVNGILHLMDDALEQSV